MENQPGHNLNNPIEPAGQQVPFYKGTVNVISRDPPFIEWPIHNASENLQTFCLITNE